MNIKQIIKDALLARDCVIEENPSTGIITVYSPKGTMWDFTIPIEMQITPEQYSFLSNLKESGETNMFDAGKWLMKKFEIDEEHAKIILLEWLNKFTNEDCRQER